jgi:hypothetical protein
MKSQQGAGRAALSRSRIGQIFATRRTGLGTSICHITKRLHASRRLAKLALALRRDADHRATTDAGISQLKALKDAGLVGTVEA